MRQQEADEPASTRSVERELAERAQLAQERQLELLSAAREAPSSAALADVSAVGAASDAEHAALLQDQLDAEASRDGTSSHNFTFEHTVYDALEAAGPCGGGEAGEAHPRAVVPCLF